MSRRIKNFSGNKEGTEINSGIIKDGKRFITHTNLHHDYTAAKTIYKNQIVFLILIIVFFAVSFWLDTQFTIAFIITLLTIFYSIDSLFNLFLATKSLNSSSGIKISKKEIDSLNDEDLPVYTVFCPLYKEWQVVNQFVDSIEKLDWPKDKLDVQFLLEEDDDKTISKIESMNLPDYFNIVIVPNSEPKTKPKACNYGLNLAKGEFSVIYDAEDKPEPYQLKKAFIAFKKDGGDDLTCIQAKLNFYNSKQNLLTRFFTMEYSLWYDLILPGMQAIKAPIPLGGTSNHFFTKDLKELQGWDPFNVTEDCDLGMRIAKLGYRTAILDSVTYEEANSNLGNWIRQRSRWIKGYMQTYLVHTRRPEEFFRANRGFRNFIFFNLTIGGKVFSLLINPIMWVLTLSYFLFYNYIGHFIEELYLEPIFYMASFSLLFGNFIAVFNYIIASVKRKRWDLIKYAILVPGYWIFISIAAWKGFVQLIHMPHYWEKTVHGLHLEDDKV